MHLGTLALALRSSRTARRTMRSSLPGPGPAPDSLRAARSNRKIVLVGLTVLVVLLFLLRPSGAPSSLSFSQDEEEREKLAGPGRHSNEVDLVLKLDKAKDGAPGAEGDRSAGANDDIISDVAKATLAKDVHLTLTQYLDYHFPLPAPHSTKVAPHIWITIASASWLRSGAFALHTFAEQLSKERIASKREKHGKETKVVTLCLDTDCIEEASRRGMYAYGGFMWNRPEKILVATWPKLAALIEVLKTRSVFFVDSDVSFPRLLFHVDRLGSEAILHSDPYPEMEPWMETYDLIAQENESFDHFNTGWLFMKQSQKTSDAWAAVLERDLKQVSRDQNNFNEILGTAELRRCSAPVSRDLPRSPARPSPPTCDGEGRFPLKSDFVSLQGIKVHILEPSVFRSHHFEADLPNVSRDQSLSLHMTCGDDGPIKEYVAKAQGFWPDTAGYYSEPRPLLTIDHLSGTKNDLVKKMKLLLTAAHYTSRAILPPLFSTVLSLGPHAKVPSLPEQLATIPHRHVYTTFPLPHLSSALDVRIVEPGYVQEASRVLAGGSVLGRGEHRQDKEWQQGDWEERAAKIRKLGDVVDIDMRQIRSFTQLYAKLSSPALASAGVIRLMNLDYQPSDRLREPTNWTKWTWPSALEHVSTCERLEDPPGCEGICRWPEGAKHEVKVDKGWEQLETILAKKEAWETS